jgi:NADH-quinone oxidoreductase subunit G
MDDVAGDAALNVSERGDRAYIGKAPGHDLTHPWASNVVDLCPVGALLSKDFLNKARAWELDRTASICPNCSQGCNAMIETRDNVVVRLRPRPNDEVNQYFMCDHGRAEYRWMNRGDRIVHPLVKVGDDHKEASWDVALATAASALRGKRTFVLASPFLSNEALYLLKRLKPAGAGYRVPGGGAEHPLPGVPDLALRADRAPNGKGAELLGYTRSDGPLSAVNDGDVLFIVDQELTDADLPHLKRASTVIFAGTVLTPLAAPQVAVAMPLANFAEEEGTFTNLRGRVQRFLQARAAPALARPSWFVLIDLLALLDDKVSAYVPSDVFAALAKDVPAFAGLSYDTLGLRGAPARNGAPS